MATTFADLKTMRDNGDTVIFAPNYRYKIIAAGECHGCNNPNCIGHVAIEDDANILDASVSPDGTYN
jgi:hypothetical protein